MSEEPEPGPNERLCPDCDAVVHRSKDFCPECNVSLYREKVTENELDADFGGGVVDASKSWRLAGLIVLAIALVAGFYLLFYFG